MKNTLFFGLCECDDFLGEVQKCTKLLLPPALAPKFGTRPRRLGSYIH